MTRAEATNHIKVFVADFAALGHPSVVPEDEDLFELGYLNSLGLVSLLAMLGDLGAAVEDGIEDYEDITTVARICDLFFG